MRNSQINIAVWRRGGNALLLSAMLLLMVVDTSLMSLMTIIFFGDSAVALNLMICFCIIIFFVGIAFLQKDLSILALLATIIVFFVSYYLYFIFGANRPLSFNALGSYYGVLTVIVFYVLAKRNLLSAAMKILFCIYAGYLVLYVVTVLVYGPEVFSRFISEKASAILTDQERGTRLFMHLGAAAYVSMYSVSKLQEVRPHYLATFGLAAFAMYLSASRFFILCVAMVFVFYVVTRRLKFVQYLCFFVYLSVSTYLIIGVFDSDFNPYTFSNTDMSILARRYEYDIIVEYIRQYPFFGIGLPDGSLGLIHYIGQVVYPTDIGIVGIWFQFGLVGVAVFGVVVSYICFIQNVERTSAVLGAADARTLSLTGCILGLYGATSDLFGGFAPLVCLILANTFYNSRLFATVKERPLRFLARRQLGRLQSPPSAHTPKIGSV